MPDDASKPADVPVGPTSEPDPITYLVDLSGREQHLVGVTMRIPPDLARDGGRLTVPTWTPGSYVIRDYVHHLQRISARDAADRPIALIPDGVSSWQVPAIDGELIVELEWYAFEASVRTNHVDDHHALLVGAATFPCLEPARGRAHHVHLTGVAHDHEVASLLPGDGDGPYIAEDHDHLVDAAFEVGALRTSAVDVHGVEHRVVWAGHGQGVDVRGLADDLGRLAHAAAELFGGDLPAQRFTVLAIDGEGGGLEHRDGCVISFPPHATTDPERRRRLQSLMSHEHFHLWNVRRMTPHELVTPPLDAPVLTTSLWIAEGWTSYYDRLLPARAGLWRTAELLSSLDRVRDTVDGLPGARIQSLHDASRTAWTKFYRRDENTPNSGTDYYTHGALAAFVLDLRLRRVDPDGDGLDAVVRDLWRRHGIDERGRPRGYTEQDVLDALARAGGDGTAALAEQLTTAPGVPDPTPDLDVIALTEVLDPDATADAVPHLGVLIQPEGGRIRLRSVLREGPAWRAGVSGGDELVAIESETLTAEELPTVLRRHGADTTVRLTLRRGPRVIERDVTLERAAPRPRLRFDETASPAAQARFTRWSGQALPG
jgi:predicted metalloprotease with PDZ domain